MMVSLPSDRLTVGMYQWGLQTILITISVAAFGGLRLSDQSGGYGHSAQKLRSSELASAHLGDFAG